MSRMLQAPCDRTRFATACTQSEGPCFRGGSKAASDLEVAPVPSLRPRLRVVACPSLPCPTNHHHSGAHGKTGTRAFMAIGVLLDDELHSFMHDLGSFS